MIGNGQNSSLTIMTENLLLTVVTLVSFIVSMVSYPVLLRFAKRHGIVDNPGSRKLHREPVPVMGGVAVYVGIMAALLVAIVLGHYDFPMTTIIGMTTMLAVGVWDGVRLRQPPFRWLWPRCEA